MKVEFVKMFAVQMADEELLFAIGDDDKLYVFNAYRKWEVHSEMPAYHGDHE